MSFGALAYSAQKKVDYWQVIYHPSILKYYMDMWVHKVCVAHGHLHALLSMFLVVHGRVFVEVEFPSVKLIVTNKQR